MDIELFRQILEELNPIFWNDKIERLRQDSDYRNQTPIQSAKWRYVIALRDFDPNQDLSAFPKSASYRRMILDERNPEKKRRDKLFREARKCLSSSDEVYDLLREGFTSLFAKRVLCPHKEHIRNFADTISNYEFWPQLIVCMSHKDFWSNLKSDNAGDIETSQGRDGQGKNWHNDDFTEVLWNGQKYKFDKLQQASAVEYLWQNRRAREKSIGEAIGSGANNFRLIHIFRQGGNKPGMHPAWETMIVPDGRGIYALAEKKNPPKK